MLVKDQSRFYKICSPAIYINITENPENIFERSGILYQLLLTKDDSTLKVALKFTFQELVA